MRQENIDFIALFEASQWSRVECAKKLKTTPATISRYLTEDDGKRIAPSPTVIELFKFILASESPGALTAAGAAREEALSDWERRIVEDLRWLHKDDRERVLIATRAIIDALPKRAPIDYRGKPPGEDLQGVSSKIADVAIGSQASASELARRETQERRRKLGADAPNEHKRGRARGGRKESGRKPGVQE